MLAPVGVLGAVEAQGRASRFDGVGEAPGAQVARAAAVGHGAAVQHLAGPQIEHPQARLRGGQVHIGHAGRPANLPKKMLGKN